MYSGAANRIIRVARTRATRRASSFHTLICSRDYFPAAGFGGKFSNRKLSIRFSYERFASSGIPA